VRVGHTTVEFFDNVADVSQDVADVLLSLSGGDGQPEYFLVEEPKPQVEKANIDAKTASIEPTNPDRKFDPKKGQGRGR
jgi:hypothetical protein